MKACRSGSPRQSEKEGEPKLPLESYYFSFANLELYAEREFKLTRTAG
jgi:hypothetical protein